MRRFKKATAAAVVLPAAAALSLAGPAQASAVFTAAQIQTAIGNVIHADVAQSVKLPSGKILWDFGDTLQVRGVSTGSHFPHSAFVTQQSGTLNFTPVRGRWDVWQQVPNWPDGTFFWMGVPVVDGGTLYVLGQRIRAPLTIVGAYMAEFNASTLAFQRIVPVPGGKTSWGGVGRGALGWWITGTHNVACTHATDCKVGDAAWVPFGHLGDTTRWQMHYGIIPVSLNLGTTVGLVNTGSGYDAFTKTGDEFGGTTVEKLHAASPSSIWSVVGSAAAPSPAGTVTYGVAVHPEQAAPAGQVMVSYDVNGFTAQYHPRFMYMSR